MGIRWPPRTASPLRLGKRSFGPGQKLIMAIVNRTPDSFYDRGATWDETAAMERVHAVVSEGADIVDIGGVPAAPGAEVTVAEEIRRTVPFVSAVRAAYPDMVISVDTWATRRRASCAQPARTCSTIPGGAETIGCPRWPLSTGRAWSVATPAGCRRGPGRTGSDTTT